MSRADLASGFGAEIVSHVALHLLDGSFDVVIGCAGVDLGREVAPECFRQPGVGRALSNQVGDRLTLRLARAVQQQQEVRLDGDFEERRVVVERPGLFENDLRDLVFVEAIRPR